MDTQRKRDVQKPSRIRDAQCMPAGFRLTVSSIFQYQQRLIKKDLFGFHLADAVFFSAFADITSIPLKTNDGSQINHQSYITQIYRICNPPPLAPSVPTPLQITRA